MACRHDYKNAIPIGRIDHICPLCKKLLDPLEWYFMNMFEFVDVTPNRKVARKGGGVAGVARKSLERKLGRSIISNQKYLKS